MFLTQDEENNDFEAQLWDVMTDRPPTTPAYSTFTENTDHLLLAIETKLMRRFDELEKKINSFSLKQLKRNRTPKNRCKASNRKGENCNGYICKRRSGHLCYAHFVLYDQNKKESAYLYSKK